MYENRVRTGRFALRRTVAATLALTLLAGCAATPSDQRSAALSGDGISGTGIVASYDGGDGIGGTGVACSIGTGVTTD